MTKEEIYAQLQSLGCKAVYVTGSRVNPHIKNPRDTEFYAIFETKEQMKKASRICNVHYITDDYHWKRIFTWSYLHHYLNQSENYVGEKCQFEEPKLADLVKLQSALKKRCFINQPIKQFYHLAMIEAIKKYGYDDIPENVVEQINDIHDLRKTYSEFVLTEEN